MLALRSHLIRPKFRHIVLHSRAPFSTNVIEQTKDLNEIAALSNSPQSDIIKAQRTERNKRYYQKNRETVQERTKQYYLKNRETLQERTRQYYKKNLETVLEGKKQYYQKNRETLLEGNKQYYQKNRQSILEAQKEYNKENCRENYKKNRELILTKQKESRDLKRGGPSTKKSWKTADDVCQNLENLGRELYIKDHTDWYRVSRAQVEELHFGSIYSKFKTLGEALKIAYPNIDWKLEEFQQRNKKSMQRWLKIKLAELLPEGTVIEEDYSYKPIGSRCFEIDLFVKEFKLGLEYQGESHFSTLRGFQPLDVVEERDVRKVSICSSEGITLVQIPYWWNRKKDSLNATLSCVMPQVFKNLDNVPPIPDQPIQPHPITIFSDVRNKTIKTRLMQGRDWETNKYDPTGWIITEKFDGFRGFWDGSSLYSKNGFLIRIPRSFQEMLPCGIPLDGEIWTEYDSFYEISALIHKSQNPSLGNEEREKLWKSVKFMIFDAPEHEGNYSQRHSYLQACLSSCSSPNICLVPLIQVCEGAKHLKEVFHTVKMKGGEGLMIYNPNQSYTPGRTNGILKVKRDLQISKVKFLQVHTASYALRCIQENQVELLVKCSSYHYKNPPEEGATILVQHSGFIKTSGKLKWPVLMSVERQELKE